MTAKSKSSPPIEILGTRVYKSCGLGELIRRLRNYASRNESWSIVHFTITGEVFEMNGRGELKRCHQ